MMAMTMMIGLLARTPTDEKEATDFAYCLDGHIGHQHHHGEHLRRAAHRAHHCRPCRAHLDVSVPPAAAAKETARAPWYAASATYLAGLWRRCCPRHNPPDQSASDSASPWLLRDTAKAAADAIARMAESSPRRRAQRDQPRSESRAAHKGGDWAGAVSAASTPVGSSPTNASSCFCHGTRHAAQVCDACRLVVEKEDKTSRRLRCVGCA